MAKYTDEEIAAMDKVLPAQAAEYLGAASMFVRCGLRNKSLPFGTAIKMKNWVYYISGPALVKYKQSGC